MVTIKHNIFQTLGYFVNQIFIGFNNKYHKVQVFTKLKNIITYTINVLFLARFIKR